MNLKIAWVGCYTLIVIARTKRPRSSVLAMCGRFVNNADLVVSVHILGIVELEI